MNKGFIIKRLTIGLALLTSLASFANCNYYIEDLDMQGCSTLSNNKILKIMKKSLAKKGYTFSEH